MKEFEMKMMQYLSFNNLLFTWRPVEHEFVDVDKWKWQYYPVIHSLEKSSAVKEKVKSRMIHEYDENI